MQTITTRYHGMTNTRGSRISATTSGGIRVYVPYRSELDIEENYWRAVEKLLERLGWHGDHYVCGSTGRGYVWTPVFSGERVWTKGHGQILAMTIPERDKGGEV